MTRIPSVVWQDQETRPGTVRRFYLRRLDPVQSWGTNKDQAEVFPTKASAAQVARALRTPGNRTGTEAGGPPCVTCGGPSHWVDTFWVCLACGDEFSDDAADEQAQQSDR
jgi:hypothetical protein